MANIQTDTQDDDAQRVCSECIGEDYLKHEVESSGEVGTCSFCEQTGQTVSMEAIAEHVKTVIETHYRRTGFDPYEDVLPAGEWVEDVIGQVAVVEPEVAEAIRQYLYESDYDDDDGENPFDGDAHYRAIEIDDWELQTGWRFFERQLKTQARYFSRAAQATLTSIFDGIDGMRTNDGRTAVVDAGPSTPMESLYRARSFQSREKLHEALKSPERDVGSPPMVAAAAGRMNARGISVFYGATKVSAAIAEVRPPVGSHVVTGRFDIIRPLRLLDLEALKDIYVTGSLFDPSYLGRLQRGRFLDRLSRRMTTPVMPDDEAFEYLATQAIADYLATDASPVLDGIIYPSVQGTPEGANVVLFYKAAKVKEAEPLPEGSEVSVSDWGDDEDPIYMFTIHEEVPDAANTAPAAKSFFPEGMDFRYSLDPDDDVREATLRLDRESLVVHRIKGVSFETHDVPVQRHRSKKSPTNETHRDIKY